MKDWIESRKQSLLIALAGIMTYTALGSIGYSNAVTNGQFLSPDGQNNQPPQLVFQQFDPEDQTQAESGCKLSSGFTPEVMHWEKEICRWSEEHQMDPDLIATIMQIESCGNDKAVSATGVAGVFQVTRANMDGLDPLNPEHAMAKGPGKVLKNELKAANGDVRAAMAGYNGGGWARKYIAGQMTRNQFIAKLRTYRLWNTTAKALAKVNEVERYAQWSNIYFESKQGRTDTLNEWLNLRGSRLCSSASYQLGLKDLPSQMSANEASK